MLTVTIFIVDVAIWISTVDHNVCYLRLVCKHTNQINTSEYPPFILESFHLFFFNNRNSQKIRKRFAPRKTYPYLQTWFVLTQFTTSFRNMYTYKCCCNTTTTANNNNQTLNKISTTFLLKIFSIFNSKETRNLKIEHMGYVEQFSIQ